MNRDPIRRLKDALRSGSVSLYLEPKNQAINLPTDRYVLVVNGSGTAAKFALVQGRYPSQRRVIATSLPSWEPVAFADIPIPMRHALAGWYYTFTSLTPPSPTP
jgi:hypothetical protein